MSIKTTTISLERFKNAVGFTATYGCTWGNTRKATMAKVTLQGTDAEHAASETEEKKAKARMQLKKQLIVSAEYDAIKSFQGKLRDWVREHSVPSFFKEGFQLVGLGGVADIEAKMKKAVTQELPALVERFIAAYPAQVREARSVLEPVGQFNADDYPAAEDLRDAFSINWAWIAFTVPEGLPAELRQAEEEKMQRTFADASQQITDALRAAFHELISHAVEKLQPGEDGKPKKIFDSMTGNILEFLNTFENRNITNDVDLAALIEQARGVLVNVTPQKLRDSAHMRETTMQQFSQLKTQLDGMVIVKPSRRFDFSQDAPEPSPTTEPVPVETTEPQPQLV